MTDLVFSWTDDYIDSRAPVYLKSCYQTMMALNDQSESRLLRIQSSTGGGSLPLLIRDLGFGKMEAYSAYGYGGVFGNLKFNDADIDCLRAFFAKESINAVFVRHSPFLQNEICWPKNNVEFNRFTYAVHLKAHSSFDSYLRELPQKVRWSVQRAQRAGISVRFTSLPDCSPIRVKCFYDLYLSLMEAKQTSTYFHFSLDFFEAHALKLGPECEFVELVDADSGLQLGGAYFLVDETGWIHYHLSAVGYHAMSQQGTELLMASALYHYGNQGYHTMHLGGGLTLGESDGLSRFKIKFSDEKLRFCCTKLICDNAAYQSERARLPLKYPELFLTSDARGS